MAEEKFFTQQWVSADVCKILHKATLTYPEFNVHLQEVEWHEDNDLVKIRLTFRNCGKVLFTQRLVGFLIKSLHNPKNDNGN